MTAVRERLQEAMLDLVCAKGYEATGVDDVVERAGLSRAEFDRFFSSKEDCTIAVLDDLTESCIKAVSAAFEAEPAWPDSMRAAAYAAADWMTEHPREVRFVTIEMLWGSDMGQVRREAGFRSFTGMIDAGREQAPDPQSIPHDTAEGLIGSIAQMLTKRLQQERVPSPYDFIPDLMYLAVRPYRGEEAARRELTMPPPPRQPKGGRRQA